MRSSPSLDKAGNLYFGVWDSFIMSVSPKGVIRWKFLLNTGDSVWGPTAAISDDGTMFIGNSIDFWYLGPGEIIALDVNGTLKWRKTITEHIGVFSSPVIAADGSVYIVSNWDGDRDQWGYLHSFGYFYGDQSPDTPIIHGPTLCTARTSTYFDCMANDSDNTPVHFLVDWGDNSTTETIDTAPGVRLFFDHSWALRGVYTIWVKAIDTFGLESGLTNITIKITYSHPLIDWRLYRFPNAFPLLRLIFSH